MKSNNENAPPGEAERGVENERDGIGLGDNSSTSLTPGPYLSGGG